MVDKLFDVFLGAALVVSLILGGFYVLFKQCEFITDSESCILTLQVKPNDEKEPSHD